MGKPADIEPRWLVSLMCQWVRRLDDLDSGALGYPSQAAFLTIGRATSAVTDPTEFSAREFAELEKALEECRDLELALWAAMMMYYKPWCVESFKAEGWPFAPNRVYWDNLKRAHQWVSSRILSMSRTETSLEST
jgi:hypothetical protein